jgi:hypothetical protein
LRSGGELFLRGVENRCRRVINCFAVTHARGVRRQARVQQVCERSRQGGRAEVSSEWRTEVSLAIPLESPAIRR